MQIFMKDRIDLGCEHLWSITQPKTHDQEFIQFVFGPHYHHFNILFYYPNLIIS
jgi:hypothetical protein